MNNYYGDILERIDEPPQWFDEHAVPRYEPFHPMLIGNIYANQACLARIGCQSCGHEFLVAFSQSQLDRFLPNDDKCDPTLADRVERKLLSYGDPPNIRCCGAGPTMSSIMYEVQQFWVREQFLWVRRPALETALIEEF